MDEQGWKPKVGYLVRHKLQPDKKLLVMWEQSKGYWRCKVRPSKDPEGFYTFELEPWQEDAGHPGPGERINEDTEEQG